LMGSGKFFALNEDLMTNGNEVIGEFAGSIEVSSSLDPQKIPDFSQHFPKS
jgi:hypothetical protein